MFYYTYVLKSEKDGRLYVGSTSNLKTRFRLHNAGQVKATQNRRPLSLFYYEACRNKKKAGQRELYFKTGFGREFLKGRI